VNLLNSTKKKIVAVGIAAAAVATSGIASAYWTQGGSGDGSVDTGTTTAITVTQTSTITDMYPGQAAQTLSGKFNNPNSGPVYVDRVTVVVDPEWASGTCEATDFTIGGSATVQAQVPAGNAQGSWTGLTIQFNNKADENQDDCKNITSVPLLYTAHASA
jgi:hypothetical protein